MFSTAIARATSPVRVCVDTPRGTHMVRGHLTLLSVYVASEMLIIFLSAGWRSGSGSLLNAPCRTADKFLIFGQGCIIHHVCYMSACSRCFDAITVLSMYNRQS